MVYTRKKKRRFVNLADILISNVGYGRNLNEYRVDENYVYAL